MIRYTPQLTNREISNILENMDDTEFDLFIQSLTEDELERLHEFAPSDLWRKFQGARKALQTAGERRGGVIAKMSQPITKAGRAKKAFMAAGPGKEFKQVTQAGVGKRVSASASKLRAQGGWNQQMAKAIGGHKTSAPAAVKVPKAKLIRGRGDEIKHHAGVTARKVGQFVSANKGKLAAAGAVGTAAFGLRKLRAAKRARQEREG